MFYNNDTKANIFFMSLRDPNLHFVESPALAPPEVQIDMVAQQL